MRSYLKKAHVLTYTHFFHSILIQPCRKTERFSYFFDADILPNIQKDAIENSYQLSVISYQYKIK